MATHYTVLAGPSSLELGVHLCYKEVDKRVPFALRGPTWNADLKPLTLIQITTVRVLNIHTDLYLIDGVVRKSEHASIVGTNRVRIVYDAHRRRGSLRIRDLSDNDRKKILDLFKELAIPGPWMPGDLMDHTDDTAGTEESVKVFERWLDHNPEHAETWYAYMIRLSRDCNRTTSADGPPETALELIAKIRDVANDLGVKHDEAVKNTDYESAARYKDQREPYESALSIIEKIMEQN